MPFESQIRINKHWPVFKEGLQTFGWKEVWQVTKMISLCCQEHEFLVRQDLASVIIELDLSRGAQTLDPLSRLKHDRKKWRGIVRRVVQY